MKKLFLTLLTVVVFIGCGSSEDTNLIPLVDIVNDSDRTFTIDDFKSVGYKQSKKYKVEELPGATSAYYGFIKNKVDPSKVFLQCSKVFLQCSKMFLHCSKVFLKCS